MPEAMPLQPEQSFARGRFVLVQRLGRGGMGEVWLARDERLREPVALKFLPPEIRGDAGALDDLCRETARSHKLSHANIVRIHDLYEDPDGMAFIVMEYIDGPTLASLRLQQPSRVLSWEYLRPLVAQLCAALEYAHGEKVIHRDLKPANLMVDSKGRLKLADFGIAAVASDSMSRISMRHSTSGTLPYMSPQQLTGQRPQAADDIYALGATLYELLTGKPPFHTGDITHQVLHQAPEPMEDRLAELGMQNDIPADAAALIMACLAKEPGERPPSARAVAEWIGLALEVKPSAESLAAALFPQTPSVPGAVAGEPAGYGGPPTPPAISEVIKSRFRPAGYGRKLAAVGIVALVVAAAFWLRKDILRRDHSSASVAAQIPTQNEPPEDLKAPPDGAVSQDSATSSHEMPETGWITLFDGHSVDAWVGSNSSTFPSRSWKIEDGVLKNIPDGPKICLFTREKFRNFELQFEWRIGYAGNSGVFYSAENDNPHREFQLADDDRTHSARSPFPEDDTGALWGVVAPSSKRQLRPNGEWNQGRLLVKGTHVEHWVNGLKVVEYELDSADFRQKIAQSHWVYIRSRVAQFTQLADMPIGLQTFFGEVSFRSIRIRRIAISTLANWKRGLVLYFPCTEPDVNGMVLDQSGQHNDGQAVGVKWVAEGHQGGGAEFGPGGGRILVPNNDGLNPPQFTLAAWIKSTRKDAVWRRIFDKGSWNNAGVEEGYDLTMGGDDKGKSFRGRVFLEVSGRAPGTKSQVTDGTWHHVAGVFDGSNLQLYVDGNIAAKDNVTKPLAPTSYGLAIGNTCSANPNTLDKMGFIGTLDDVMMFNRALSAEEISQLYESQK